MNRLRFGILPNRLCKLSAHKNRKIETIFLLNKTKIVSISSSKVFLFFVLSYVGVRSKGVGRGRKGGRTFGDELYDAP